MDIDDQRDADDSADDVILLPDDDETSDALQEFLTWLESVDPVPSEDRDTCKRLRFRSHPTPILSNQLPLLVIVECLIYILILLTPATAHTYQNPKHDTRVIMPSVSFAPHADDELRKQLVLNVGSENGLYAEWPDGPVVFYAGEAIPVEDCSAALTRESFLYQDLGVDLDDITVIIRADRHCPHGAITETIRLAQEAGFVHFRLRVQICPEGDCD